MIHMIPSASANAPSTAAKDFQKSPSSDFIWRGTTSSLAVGRFAAKQCSFRSPRGRLVASLQLPVLLYRSEERAIFSSQKVLLLTSKQPYISDCPVPEDFNIVVASRGGTLRISGWGCAAGTPETLTCIRASSAEFCYPILE